VSFVEVWCLKTECVQVCVLGTTLPSFVFSSHQKAMPMSETTKLVFYPQQIDVKPIPICFGYHTSYNYLVRRVKNETQALKLIIACLLFVVIGNASSNDAPCRFFRLINVDDLIFVSHMVLVNSFL